MRVSEGKSVEGVAMDERSDGVCEDCKFEVLGSGLASVGGFKRSERS